VRGYPISKFKFQMAITKELWLALFLRFQQHGKWSPHLHTRKTRDYDSWSLRQGAFPFLFANNQEPRVNIKTVFQNWNITTSLLCTLYFKRLGTIWHGSYLGFSLLLQDSFLKYFVDHEMFISLRIRIPCSQFCIHHCSVACRNTFFPEPPWRIWRSPSTG